MKHNWQGLPYHKIYVVQSLCFMCWLTWISSSLFVLVNHVSTHALSQYLEVNKELFIWLHALYLSQQYLNSWDNHDTDLEPYLEFFSLDQTLKIFIITYSSLQIDDLDANTHGKSLSSWHPYLNPTHGQQELPMEYSFI